MYPRARIINYYFSALLVIGILRLYKDFRYYKKILVQKNLIRLSYIKFANFFNLFLGLSTIRLQNFSFRLEMKLVKRIEILKLPNLCFYTGYLYSGNWATCILVTCFI